MHEEIIENKVLRGVEGALADKLRAVELSAVQGDLNTLLTKVDASKLSDAEATLAPILAAVVRVDRLARRLGIMPGASQLQEQLEKLPQHFVQQLEPLLHNLDQQMEGVTKTLAMLEASALRFAAQLWPVHDLLAAVQPSLPAVKDVREVAAWVSACERELRELREMVRPRSV